MSCGYRAIFSPEPVAAAIQRDEEGRIWLLRRALHEGTGVLVVYSARALGIAREPKEAIEVRAFGPEELPWDELTFWSTEQALRDLLG